MPNNTLFSQRIPCITQESAQVCSPHSRRQPWQYPQKHGSLGLTAYHKFLPISTFFSPNHVTARFKLGQESAMQKGLTGSQNGRRAVPENILPKTHLHSPIQPQFKNHTKIIGVGVAEWRTSCLSASRPGFSPTGRGPGFDPRSIVPLKYSYIHYILI
jgi:hypothetical protein